MKDAVFHFVLLEFINMIPEPSGRIHFIGANVRDLFDASRTILLQVEKQSGNFL